MRIILIEDSKDVYFLVKTAMGAHYSITWAPSLCAAEKILKKSSFDLVLLDVVLPDGDGFAFCAKLQTEASYNFPIIFLTGKTGTSNLVTGLTLGGDDYIQKPFDPLELKARIETRLNKLARIKHSEKIISKGNLRISLERQTVYLVTENGEIYIDVTPIEYKLLCHFASNEDRVFTRDQLLSAVWGENVFIGDRTVDRHVSFLRQKLKSCSYCIETVAGFGYKFTMKSPPIEELKSLGRVRGVDVLSEMIEMFNITAPGRVRIMGAALKNKDWKTLEREAHTLKTSSGFLGLLKLQEVCSRIVSAPKQDPFHLQELISNAGVELSDGLNELKSLKSAA